MFQITSNYSDIERRYQRRASALQRANRNTKYFAQQLSMLRKANLERMIYQRTPYKNHKYPKMRPTGELKRGERVNGNDVYNIAKHSSIRANMKGDYVISPGTSKEADWEQKSIQEIRPLMTKRQRATNRNFIQGRY